MDMTILQTLGLLASIFVAAIGVIKWLLTRIESSTVAIRAEINPQLVALSTRVNSAMDTISDVRVGYATKAELTAVVQMFQNTMDKQSAEHSRAIDGITSRIDNLINIVTRQHNNGN
jgi:hypothetical protein